LEEVTEKISRVYKRNVGPVVADLLR